MSREPFFTGRRSVAAQILEDVARGCGIARGAAGQDLLEEGKVAAAGRRRARDGVEHLAVLQRVMRLALDHAILVEIDGENGLFRPPRLHEGNRSLALLRDAVEDLAI